MKRASKWILVPAVLASLSLAGLTKAQDRPAPPAGGPDNQQGPMNGPQDGPPGGGPQGDGGGPGGPGGDHQGPGGDRQGPGGDRQGPGGDRRQGGGPQTSAPSGTNDVMRYQNYLNMVSQYSKMASDPDSAGVAAVVSAGDVLRRQGPQAAIDFFNKQLPNVKIDAVRRAIRLQLVDLYKAVKDDGKALEQLQMLITADGAVNSKTQ